MPAYLLCIFSEPSKIFLHSQFKGNHCHIKIGCRPCVIPGAETAATLTLAAKSGDYAHKKALLSTHGSRSVSSHPLESVETRQEMQTIK